MDEMIKVNLIIRATLILLWKQRIHDFVVSLLKVKFTWCHCSNKGYWKCGISTKHHVKFKSRKLNYVESCQAHDYQK